MAQSLNNERKRKQPELCPAIFVKNDGSILFLLDSLIYITGPIATNLKLLGQLIT